jgi:ribosomal protein L40E
MARKTRGFVQLEWVCPNCSTRNPGPKESCTNCGAPQPENVQFERAVEEKLVTDADALAAAQAGADYICPYCGTRNSGTATACVQCGGDLVEAKRRAAGAELQANTGPKEITCTNCGTANPATRSNCSKCGAPLPRTETAAQMTAASRASAAPRKKLSRWWLWAGLAAALLLCAGFVGLFALPTAAVEATVTNVHWETSVPVQEMQAVHYSNESGSPPSGAYDVSCHEESHDVCQDRVVDQGNGYGEVVQDCDNVTEQYCSYTVDEWETIQTYSLEGSDYWPVYAQPSISSGQRLGDENVDLVVVFDTENGQKRYSPSGVDEFAQYTVGSGWMLQLNAVGGILDVER